MLYIETQTRYLPSWVKGLSYVEVLGGLILLPCTYYCFCVFGFLWYYVYVLIYGGTVSLPKYFFFRMVSVLWFVSHLKFTFADNFPIHVMLHRLICLFMLIFFLHFLYICVILHLNFYSLYILSFSYKYGSWHTRTVSLETIIYSHVVCL